MARGGGHRLRVEVSEGPPSARVALHGEFDIDSADEATLALSELLDRRPDAVVLDLRGLDFMDSTGVKFLVDARDRAHELGVELSLVYGGDRCDGSSQCPASRPSSRAVNPPHSAALARACMFAASRVGR